MFFDMFLPLSGQWYADFLAFICSNTAALILYITANAALTLCVLNAYAKPFIVRSYKNYIQSTSMDMETLISLGCVSAFLLFCFFMGQHAYNFLSGSDKLSINHHNLM